MANLAMDGYFTMIEHYLEQMAKFAINVILL